ncbi:hypothetical protein PQX77_018867 [Marasmius sp. AFHP31]|nr:hypothetical protein PQX77_018867 [Marasmius sp. AFHP31]
MDDNQPTPPKLLVSTFCFDHPRACSLNFTAPVVITCVQLLCYGTHLFLFAVCISVLARRRPGRFRIHCFHVTALFVLATLAVILNIVIMIPKIHTNIVVLNLPHISFQPPLEIDFDQRMGTQQLRPDDMLNIQAYARLERLIGRTSYLVNVTSNLICDIVLLYRCHHIWKKRICIVLLPAILCIGNNGYMVFLAPIRAGSNGFVRNGLVEGNEPQDRSILILCFSLGSFLSNLLLTGLIVGRVFYIRRQISTNCEQPVIGMYRTIIHASIESGILVPMAQFVYTVLMILDWSIFRNLDHTSPAFASTMLGVSVIKSASTSIMGIASTLIIVRIVLGIAIDDEQSFRDTVLGEGDHRSREARGTIESVVLNIERREDSCKTHDEENAEVFEPAPKTGEQPD